ncbi:MAG: hypothetical protein EOR56_28420 [Mesorhizobium sp.]|nr:MAG: hypothetical protein EOR56_28420 [Mesorhizobium sp.]
MNAEAVHPGDGAASYLFANCFDPIEAGLQRVRGFIETMLETELDAVLARRRYGRQPAARSDETIGVAGHRLGRRTRTLTGTFGTTEITVSRARPRGRHGQGGGMEEQGPARLSATHDGTVNKHRTLLAHAPERLHEEIRADYTDMIYAATPEEIETRRKAFLRKWRLKCRAVADSLEEASERLFAFTRLPSTQWKSARTTNAIERLHEEFKRRIKTQTVLPSAETAAMLFWALMASGQISMRKTDGWQTLAAKPLDQQIDLAA